MTIGDKIEKLIKNIGLPLSITTKLNKKIAVNFDLGVQDIEQLINKNILDINPDVLSNLKKYNFDLIKDVNNDLAQKLRSTLERSIIEGKSKRESIKQIKKIFDTSDARARSIAVTETHRAFGIGQLEAAKKSPIKLKKYILAVNDSRTSPLCKRLSSKYNKDNTIPINAKFKDKTIGESWLSNPYHTNCRSKVIYIPADINE